MCQNPLAYTIPTLRSESSEIHRVKRSIAPAKKSDSAYCISPPFKRHFSKKTQDENSLAGLYSHHYSIVGAAVPDICTKDVADCRTHNTGSGCQLLWVSAADVITNVSFITSTRLIWPLNRSNMDLCCVGQSSSVYAAQSTPECSGRYFICQQCFFQLCPIKIVWVDGWCGETRFSYLWVSLIFHPPPTPWDLYYTFHQKHQRHASSGLILMPASQRLMMCAFLV